MIARSRATRARFRPGPIVSRFPGIYSRKPGTESEVSGVRRRRRFDASPAVQKYAWFGRPGCRNAPSRCLPVQKYARFWAPGGVYGALFSPAGRVMPRVPVPRNGRNY